MAYHSLHPQINKEHLCHDINLVDEQCHAYDYASGHSDLTENEKEAMIKVLVERSVEEKLKYHQRFKPLQEQY